MKTQARSTTRNPGHEGAVWFIGRVEDVNDPAMLGRVRVRVINEHEGAPAEDLCWAPLVMPPSSAFHRHIGSSPTGIEVGSTVIGIWMDGAERQQPIVLGTLGFVPAGMGAAQSSNPEQHDVTPLARGTNVLNKERIGPEPPSAYGTRYPHNKVVHTARGHAIEIDDTPGEERIHVYHRSGTYVEIANDGRYVRRTVSDDVLVIDGDRDVYITGDCRVTVLGDATVIVKGDAGIRVDGDMSTDVGGKYSVRSGGTMTLSAPRLDINKNGG